MREKVMTRECYGKTYGQDEPVFVYWGKKVNTMAENSKKALLTTSEIEEILAAVKKIKSFAEKAQDVEVRKICNRFYREYRKALKGEDIDFGKCPEQLRLALLNKADETEGTESFKLYKKMIKEYQKIGWYMIYSIGVKRLYCNKIGGK